MSEIRCKKHVNFFPHPLKGKTIVVPLPLVLPTSRYCTAAVLQFFVVRDHLWDGNSLPQLQSSWLRTT